MSHHLIFEGAELAGKSWLMSQVYDALEPKYNQNKNTLDGCHWFNCDVGIYGTKHGHPIIKHYLEIFKELQNKNILVEKLHLADLIYNRLHNNLEIDYLSIEKELLDLKFKIILICFPEDKKVLQKRIQDRLNIYPHYEQILKNPDWYIEQQREYQAEIKKSILPSIVIETTTLPDYNLSKKILNWIGE